MGTPGTPTVPASLAQMNSSKPSFQLPREQVPLVAGPAAVHSLSSHLI